MQRALVISLIPRRGGVTVSVRQWDFASSPYPRQVAHQVLATGKPGEGRLGLVRWIAEVVSLLADHMEAERE